MRKRVTEDLHGRQQQDRAEEEKGPREPGDEFCAQIDEDPTQDQRTCHADQEHPLLKLSGHGEGGE